MSVANRRVRLVSRGDLPGSNGGIYNPGAILHSGSFLMLCRREIDYRFSDCVFPELFCIDPQSLAVTSHRTLRRGRFPEGARIEDFRCIEFDGEVLVVHPLVHDGRTRPIISRIAGDHLEPVDDFQLPFATRAVEKNWVLFVRNGALHCVYALDPLVVLARGGDGAWTVVMQEDTDWACEFDEMLSNSANLVPFMHGYLGFWHTRVNDRYVQGAYLLGQDLRLRCRTGILLDGADVTTGWRPGVLYVSSLVLHDGHVHAFYGEGDAHASVAVFDAADLAAHLAATPFEYVQRLRVRYHGDSMGDLYRAMRMLQRFSHATGAPAIRLDTDDRRAVAPMRRFAIPNVLVTSRLASGGYDYDLSGPAGRLLPLPKRDASTAD